MAIYPFRTRRTEASSVEPISAEGIQRRMLTLEEETIGLFRQVNRSGKFFQAERVRELESLLERLWGMEKAFAVSSGTAALRLAYEYVKIKYGREVREHPEIITTPLSYIATAYPASEAGFTVRFADIEPYTYTLDPEAVRRAITPNTVAIVPVHLYGQAAAMQELLDIGKEYGIPIIEDMAQAHDATYRMYGKEYFVGSQGYFGCTSFYIGKNAGSTGDTGAICTSDREMASYIIGGRDQGRNSGERYEHPLFGWKFRVREFDAACIAHQITSYLQAWTKRRQSIAMHYHAGLADIRQLHLPYPAAGNRHVYYKYAVLCATPAERAHLEQHLTVHGIQTERIYPKLIPAQPQYSSGNLPCIVDPLPVAQSVVDRLLCLPIYEFLRDDEVERVIETVWSAF